jgi:hypothetical protein
LLLFYGKINSGLPCPVPRRACAHEIYRNASLRACEAILMNCTLQSFKFNSSLRDFLSYFFLIKSRQKSRLLKNSLKIYRAFFPAAKACGDYLLNTRLVLRRLRLLSTLPSLKMPLDFAKLFFKGQSLWVLTLQ